MLQEIASNIWTLDGDPIRFFGIPFPIRMTVVRLPDNRLWLHSPVAYSESRAEQVAALGRVSYIVAPNSFHHLYIGHWQRHFPDAQIWGTTALQKKRKDLTFDGILNEHSAAPWQPHIDQLLFAGNILIPEFMFLHAASRTLIMTDYIQNHDPHDDGWFWRQVKRVIGVLAPHGGVPLDLRLSTLRRKEARRSLEQLLAWDFERILIAHGDCIMQDGKEYARNAFRWLA
ncbi:MAG: DUF4336 domain-containing protein [Leptospiraceae bacterium]|nr:DUF4336 domain-containing protein [Leptospiraceae bacterium]